ncbi:MAG TPA: hypothetical protein VF955_04375 [Pyrinomonadaceae bacterium]
MWLYVLGTANRPDTGLGLLAVAGSYIAITAGPTHWRPRWLAGAVVIDIVF